MLVFTGTRLSCLLLLVMAIPLWFEMEAVLNIWLTDVPDYTLIFCRIMLINVLLDTTSNYFATAMQATGKIRNYQIVVSLVLFMNFPLSYLFIRLTHLPYVIYYVYGFISSCLLFTRMYLVARELEIRLWVNFLKTVLWPVTRVLICAVPMSYLAYRCLDNLSLIPQFICVIILCALITGISSLVLGLNCAEKKRVISIVKSKIRRQ